MTYGHLEIDGEVILGLEVSPDMIAPQDTSSNRVLPVVQLARGKRVLNIGCCGSDVLMACETVHRQIAKVASFCVGLDIYEEGVLKMKADGENVFLANAEYFELDIKDFDLIVLGDIIEHVSNPGLALDNANRHLQDNGKIVITTPTPFSLTHMLRVLIRGTYYVNSEHVLWFDPIMLAFLLERSGFRPERIFWTGKSSYSLINLLLRARMSLHDTFGIVAKKVRSAQAPKASCLIRTS
jgi:SAM-dependent methyltransferase